MKRCTLRASILIVATTSVIFTYLLSAMTQGYRSTPDTSSQDAADWTPLRPVSQLPTGTIARFGTIARLGKDNVIIGNSIPTLVGGNRHSSRSTFAGVFLSGANIPAPTEYGEIIMPQAFPLSDSCITLIWGERSASEISGAPAIDWLSVNPTQLWTADYSHTQGWTIPRMLFEGSIIWSKEDASGAFTVEDGIVVAVPIRRHNSAPRGGILILTRNHSEWKTEILPLQAPPAMTSASALRGNLHIGFLAPVVDEVDDVNSVQFVSKVAGKWTAPLVLQRSGHSPSHFVRVLCRLSSGIRIVWHQVRPFAGHFLMTSSMDPASLQMSGVDSVSLAGDFNSGTAILGMSDEIHVVFQNYPNGDPEGSLNTIVWSGGWTAQVSLFPSYRAIDVALAPSGTGSILMLTTAQPKVSKPGTPYSSMLSELRK